MGFSSSTIFPFPHFFVAKLDLSRKMLLATKVGPRASGLEARTVDHRELVKPHFDLDPTEGSGFLVIWERLVCSVMIISACEDCEDMLNANDNDKKIKVFVTQVRHFVEENYLNINSSVK